MNKKNTRYAVTLEILYFFTRYLITFMLHNSTITPNQNYMSDCVLTKNSNSPKHIQIMNNYLVGYNKLTICTSISHEITKVTWKQWSLWRFKYFSVPQWKLKLWSKSDHSPVWGASSSVVLLCQCTWIIICVLQSTRFLLCMSDSIRMDLL